MKPAVVPVRSLLALSALCLALLTGCGTQMQNRYKIQPNLIESLRCAQLGQTAQARQWADRAIAVDPNALSTYVNTSTSPDDDLSIAQVFGTSGDNTTLLAYMQQAAQKHPDSYEPLEVIDQVQGRLGDTAGQKATATKLAVLLEAKMVTPGKVHDKELQLALAQAYCDAGNLTKGVADFQAALQATPNNPDALNGLAYEWAVANSTPNLPQARADVQQAIALIPKQGWSDDKVAAATVAYMDTLGWVQYRMGDYKNALDNIQSAVNADPRVAEERYHLGMVYEALNQPDAARAEFTHATLLSQGYKAAQTELSRLKEATPPKAATTQTAQR